MDKHRIVVEEGLKATRHLHNNNLAGHCAGFYCIKTRLLREEYKLNKGITITLAVAGVIFIVAKAAKGGNVA